MDGRRIPVTQLVLWFLEKSIGAGEMFIGSAIDLRRDLYKVYNDYPTPPSGSTLSQAIRRLRERGLIKIERRKVGEMVLHLTEAGRDFALLTSDEGEWDGRWRIVVFDIPEDRRSVRNVLRNKLKQWGFVQWQKSVWATKKPLTDKLRQIATELGIDGWVLVIESDNVGKK